MQKEKDFCNPKCKKNKFWEDISAEMKKKKYNYTAQECHAKYRNLLQTYKLNKEKRLKSTGESKITWEFFDQFDEVLGCKSSTSPAEYLLSTSMEIESDQEVKLQTQDKENKDTQKKLSVSRYLYEKNKARSRQEEKEDLRWAEKKALKEKEIEAINNLADAIRGDIRRKRRHSDSE